MRDSKKDDQSLRKCYTVATRYDSPNLKKVLMPSNSSRIFFSITFVALFAWIGAVSLTNHLAGSSSAPIERGAPAQPKNPTASALQRYLSTLENDPKNEEALLGVARLSFESGVLDKALGYYERYLDIRPDDLRAQTDYALVLIQSDKATDAVELLESIVDDNPDLFPARLSLALGYKMTGKIEQAREAAQSARKFAPNEEAVGVLDKFVHDLDLPPDVPVRGQSNGTESKTRSPAMIVNSFFRNHPIVGPKVESITWPKPDTAVVALKDFPVAAMPPFAKEKFLKSVDAALASAPEHLNVKLIDASTKAELLSFSGGGPNGAK